MVRPRCACLFVLLSLSFALTACSGGSASHSTPLSITVTVSKPASTIIDPGNPVTLQATVANDTGAGVTWSLSGPDCSGAACGALSSSGTSSTTYTAPAKVSTSLTAKITATSIADSSKSDSVSLTVPASLNLSPAAGALPSGSVANAYSQILTVSGGIDPYTWKLTEGALPAGLSLSKTGEISGTPTAGSDSSVTVTATDSGKPTALTASARYTISIAWPKLVISPGPLPRAYTGAGYSQTFSATGGSGTGYTWTVTSGSTLPAGMSLSSAGVFSGIPTQAATSDFGVTVTDSAQETAKALFSLIVDSGLTVTTASLPNGYPGTKYTATTLAAAGGTGTGLSWSWTAASGSSLPAGLSISSVGVVSGTPTTAGAYNVVVSVSDSAKNKGSATLTLTVEPVLSITSPAALPSSPNNIAYSQQLHASGGSNQGYQWTVAAGESQLQALSLDLGSDGVLEGTPPTAGTAAFTAQVTDSEGHLASAPLSVAILQGYAVSGHVNAMNGCPGSYLPPISFSINSIPVQQTRSDNTGAFTFASVPDGNYTITPSITGAESQFYPAQTNVVVNGAAVGVPGFGVALGYTVSGHANYAGTQQGTVFFTLNGCGNGIGTSISQAQMASGGAFILHGVPLGTSSLRAVMDAQGFGFPINQSFPSGTVASIPVNGANVSGLSVTLTDPPPYAIATPPQIHFLAPVDQGVLFAFQGVKGNDSNGNTFEVPPYYRIQWNSTNNFSSVAAANNFIFPAGKSDGAGVVFLTNTTTGVTGNPFINGQQVYFRIQGYVSANNPDNGPWAYFGGSTPATDTPVTIGALTGTNEIDGQIIFTGPATGPLYVGYMSTQTGLFYGQVIPNPVSPQDYQAFVPTGNGYMFVAIVDNNNDGLISPGDLTNVRNGGYSMVNIAGPETGQDLTLPADNSTALLTTQYMKWTNSNMTVTSYGVGVKVVGQNQPPVAVELVSGPNLLNPVDISRCFTCGDDEYQYNSPLFQATPTAGDTYTLNVTYNGIANETKTSSIQGVFSDTVTLMIPQQTTYGVSSTPTFSWNYPAADSGNYSYTFRLMDNNGNTIWQIPAMNADASAFTQPQIPSTSGGSGITWGTDPTNGSNPPTVGSLTSGVTYNWAVTAIDPNGNMATRQMWFTVP